MVPGLLEALALGAGGYHGYCNAQEIVLQENTKWTLTYGPAIIQGGLVGTLLGMTGFVFGGAVGLHYGPVAAFMGAGAGGAIGGSTGLALGAAIGGLETLMGYGGGYCIGCLAPKRTNTSEPE